MAVESSPSYFMPQDRIVLFMAVMPSPRRPRESRAFPTSEPTIYLMTDDVRWPAEETNRPTIFRHRISATRWRTKDPKAWAQTAGIRGFEPTNSRPVSHEPGRFPEAGVMYSCRYELYRLQRGPHQETSITPKDVLPLEGSDAIISRLDHLDPAVTPRGLRVHLVRTSPESPGSRGAGEHGQKRDDAASVSRLSYQSQRSMSDAAAALAGSADAESSAARDLQQQLMESGHQRPEDDRTPLPRDDASMLAMVQKRVHKGDAEAIYFLGCKYNH
ncbi:hypothetical protein THAOC_12508, partial [Thalassiosira oceanica]